MSALELATIVIDALDRGENKNKSLNTEEAGVSVEDLQKLGDANGDGLSAEELAGKMGTGAELALKMLKGLDKDTFTRAFVTEAQAAAGGLFDKLKTCDTDFDGHLQLSELKECAKMTGGGRRRGSARRARGRSGRRSARRARGRSGRRSARRSKRARGRRGSRRR